MDIGSIGAPFYRTLTGVTMHHVKKINANTESKAAKYIVTLVSAVALPIFAILDATVDVVSLGLYSAFYDKDGAIPFAFCKSKRPISHEALHQSMEILTTCYSC